jgi:membrane protease YdiL (CAAX protease family)
MTMNNISIGYKILHFPLIKILIGLIIVAGIYILSQFLLKSAFSSISSSGDLNNLLTGISAAILALFSYVYLYKFYEKRKITELDVTQMGKSIVMGTLLGASLQALTILIIYLKGGYSVISINNILFVIPGLTMAFSSAIFEEILLRGIIFRLTEEKLGSYIALIISALIFGALHLANPNSSLILALGLAIQAGLLLAVAYMYTRNLWFPIAIHFAWNFTQSGVFGANVSGNSIGKSLLTSKIEGENWFTGGAFGPEGSIQATLFCLLATILLLTLCIKQHKIIVPFWKTSSLKFERET